MRRSTPFRTCPSGRKRNGPRAKTSPPWRAAHSASCPSGQSRKALQIGRAHLLNPLTDPAPPTLFSRPRGLSPALPRGEPVYPLTEGLSLNQVRKAVDAALNALPDFPEWQEAEWVARQNFPALARAPFRFLPLGQVRKGV